jgi:hypothetical protein
MQLRDEMGKSHFVKLADDGCGLDAAATVFNEEFHLNAPVHVHHQAYLDRRLAFTPTS